METIVRVTAEWEGFETFDLKELKYIPRAGEYFNPDEEKYPMQSLVICSESIAKGSYYLVRAVIHHFQQNKHIVEIRLCNAQIYQ